MVSVGASVCVHTGVGVLAGVAGRSAECQKFKRKR